MGRGKQEEALVLSLPYARDPKPNHDPGWVVSVSSSQDMAERGPPQVWAPKNFWGDTSPSCVPQASWQCWRGSAGSRSFLSGLRENAKEAAQPCRSLGTSMDKGKGQLELLLWWLLRGSCLAVIRVFSPFVLRGVASGGPEVKARTDDRDSDSSDTLA